MPNVIKQSGAQSATIGVDNVTGSASVADWAQLPKGKLKDLLNTKYGAFNTAVPPVFVPSFADFYNAYASAGGMTSLLAPDANPLSGATYMTEVGSFWELDGDGYPQLYSSNEDTLFQARISVSYSASE